MDAVGLERVFRNVQASLVEGGLFLFDLNMDEGFRARWRGSFGIVEDDNACILRSTYNTGAGIARADVTMFRPEGHAWRRSDVTLFERCHPEGQVKAGLGSAGLVEVCTYDAVDDFGLTNDIGRSFFLAKKAGA